MKDNRQSHKSENTFKFQTFSERIASVYIDVIHRIGVQSSTPEEAETFFVETLGKWNELNCTESYDFFKKDLGYEIETLAQLIHNKDEVVGCLEKHLQIEGTLALEPLLELVVALARDLQSDFYPYFPKFFNIIRQLLKTNDTELLEWSFTCLSYLFKFLWKFMIKDMKKVFIMYLPLLSERQPEYIRNFAAESFAFLIRKVPDKSQLLDFVFNRLDTEYSLGVGQLLFEVIKGIKQQFHSNISTILPIILSKLGVGDERSNTELPWSFVLECECQMIRSICNHSNKTHMSVVWDILEKYLLNSLMHRGSENKCDFAHMENVLKIVEIFATFRNGELIENPKNYVDMLCQLLTLKSLPDTCAKSLIDLVANAILNFSTKLEMASIRRLVSQVFDSNYSNLVIFQFVHSMFPYGMFEKDVLPHFLNFCADRVNNNSDEQLRNLVLISLADVVLHFRPPPETGDEFSKWQRYKLDFRNFSENVGQISVSSLLENYLNLDVEDIFKNLPYFCVVLLLIPHVRPLRTKQIMSKLQNLRSNVVSLVNPEKHPFIVNHIITAQRLLQKENDFFETFDDAFLIELLSSHPKNIFVLRMTNVLLSKAKTSNYELLDSSLMETIFRKLQFNLTSPYREVRLLTLKILSSFELSLPRIENKNVQQMNVFRICLAAEEIEPTVYNYRDKLQYLQKLDHELVRCNIPNGPYGHVPLLYLLGALYVNFKLLWAPILKLVESHARGMKDKQFWSIFTPHLEEVACAIEETTVLKVGESNVEIKLESNENDFEAIYHDLSMASHESIDYKLHREMLWKAMSTFSDIAEPRNKDILPIFFRFIEGEYYRSDTNIAPTQDLRRNVGGSDEESEITKTDEIETEIDGSDDVVGDVKKHGQTTKNNASEDTREETVENADVNEDDFEVIDISDDDSDTIDISDDEVEIIDSENEDTRQVNSVEDSKDQSKIENRNKRTSDTNKDESIGDVVMAESDDENADKNNSSATKKNKFNKRQSQVMKSDNRCSLKSLLAHLTVVAKFRNPKALHREADLRELFENLLTHKCPKVQQLSLDFIMAYNDKAVVPYKENLYNLLNDKTFKTEITAFNIDVQSKIIVEEHRIKVLPLLMRIMYGKMNNSVGKSNGGNNRANLKRGIVMRFLAGTQPSELKMFLDLAFQPFQQYLNDEIFEMISNITTNLNLEAVFPLKRMQAALNLLGIVISKVGNLMDEYLPWVLKLLLCMLATVIQLLEQRSKIHPRFVVHLRDLRTFAMAKLAQFFELFDNYAFSSQEIEAVFEVVVWPQLQQFHLSVNSVSSLLKLMETWSRNPRYFVLFAKYHVNDKNLSPLPQIMKLYASSKCRSPVVNCITNILENLFTFSDYDPNAQDDDMEVDDEQPVVKAPLLVVENCVDVNKKTFESMEEPPNYGTLLLLPHITRIFSRLKITVSTLKHFKNDIPETILTILLRTSEHVHDPHQCKKLISLLFSYMDNLRRIPSPTQTKILKTMAVLLKHSAHPEAFVRKIAPLFGFLKDRNSRATLCEMLRVIAERNETYKTASEVISSINSWDATKFEEVNYNERLDGYQKATSDITEMISNQLEYCRLIIFNCCYVIRTIDDTALRSCSSNFLRELVSQFVFDDVEKKNVCLTLLRNSILPQIKKGLKSKDEIIRHEFIKLLDKTVRGCKDVPELRDLQTLCNDDLDIDFFENIRHVQILYRARALTRLARNKELNTFQVGTLMDYLMPLASSFLYSAVYSKHPNLIDAAVEFVGSVSRVLPWKRYDLLLKHYLTILPKDMLYQKLSVKLVVAILDGFHFDLSASEGVYCGLKAPPMFFRKNKPSEKEEEKENGVMECDVDEDIEKIEETNNNEIKIICGRVSATRIHHHILKNILPQLNRCLTKKARQDDNHKLAKKNYVEDEEILRVPIALAVVKLLQNLPKGTLEKNLPGLFFKLCAFLKSRAESIRTTTRTTLVKVMDSLGPFYFPYLVKQMQQTMTRGYQVHVMIFTLHAVLNNLASKLSTGDLDPCLTTLISVCSTELFGTVAEEKEVEQIVGKLKEARGCKSYNMFEIMSKFISENHLVPLVAPIKEILATARRHQVVRKAEECLRCIVLGLTENKSIPATQLLIFAHGLIKENIPALNPKRSKGDGKQLPPHLQRPDSYLVPAEPKRTATAPTSAKTNAHSLIEFGLHLVYFLLKRGKLTSTKEEHLKMVDPFISILVEGLQSVHTKIVSFSLRCLQILVKFPLPALKSHIKRLISSLFVLLNKYVGSQGENEEMTTMGFKLVSVIVRDIEFYTITSDQLRVLLTYAEQDILDHMKQARAFSLIKAILARKLVDTQIDEVMKKIAEMSIRSEVDHVRVQCRQVFYQYLVDYPIGKHMDRHLGFYCAQLCFEHEYGRKSALEMLQSIITTFPENRLKKHIADLFVPLSTCLVNDDSAVCRKMAINAVKTALTRLDAGKRDYLYGAMLAWLRDIKLTHQRLGAQLCGILADVEKEKFENRITKLLPLFIERLDPAKYIEKTNDEHLVYHLLTSIVKMIEECKLLDKLEWQSDLNLFWEYVRQHLQHRDDTVRLVACQLVGLLFSRHSVDEIATSVCDSVEESIYYLLFDSKNKVLKLCQSLISQFQAPTLEPALQDQVIKNLVYVAKIARALETQRNISTSSRDGEEEEEEQKEILLDWLIRKMVKESRFEVIHHPAETTKRTCVFKWIAAVALSLGNEGLQSRLSLMISPLHREMSDNSPQSDATLKSLAQQVVDIIQGIVDPSTFATHYAELQKSISEKRTARKRDKNLEVILDPVVAQRKRTKKHNAKKEAKRRKIEKIRTSKLKKKSLKDFAMVS